MKSILKNSNGKAVSTNGKLFTVSANYTDQIKQALIDKGVATEDTPSSEIPNVIRGISALKPILDNTKSCEKLFDGFNGTSVDELINYSDTENVTNARYMFNECYYLLSIPLLNISQLINAERMFYNCEQIKTLPQLDTSKVEDMGYFCSGCSNLTEFNLNTRNVKKANYMFNQCHRLKTIRVDFINVTSGSLNITFNLCKALENLTVLNIKVPLPIGSGTIWGHLLTLDSLINTIKELVNTGSSKTLTMGSANLEKIANIYVRRTTEGDIPTCLSDNSNIDLAKAPCEICNAEDEGAMSIIAYANSKNWTIA